MSVKLIPLPFNIILGVVFLVFLCFCVFWIGGIFIYYFEINNKFTYTTIIESNEREGKK